METTLEVLRMAAERINQNLDDAVDGNIQAQGRILTSLAVMKITIGRTLEELKKEDANEEAEKDKSTSGATE